MIMPQEWTRFESDDEKLEYLREKGLVTPKATSVKSFAYAGDYTDTPVLCEVVGYATPIDIIVSVGGEYHCLHYAYLAEMQAGMSKWIAAETQSESAEDICEPLDFIAIDFETANSKPSSACSVGLAFVENGIVVNTEYSLLRPEPFAFDMYNTHIHGISESDVENAPTFAEWAAATLPKFENKLLVAHNASFDMSVLRHALDLHGIACPTFDYACTYVIAQEIMPEAKKFSLNELCNELSIDLDHHNAQSDAEACARLLLALLQNSDQIEPFLTSFAADVKRSAAPKRKKTHAKTNLPENLPISENFRGKNFVFTGDMDAMSRSTAREIVAACGGTAHSTVTTQIDYLVQGKPRAANAKTGLSTKALKAMELAEKGHKIRVLTEQEFIAMLPTELYDFVCPSLPDGERFFALIKDELFAVLDDNNCPDGVMEYAPLKDRKTYSCQYRNSLFFRVSFNAKTNWIYIPLRYDSTMESAGFEPVSKDTYVSKYAIKDYSDALLLSDVLCVILNLEIDRSQKGFGCCSHYVECSDAKRCVQQDKILAMDCAYRINLKHGRIFYGVNAIANNTIAPTTD